MGPYTKDIIIIIAAIAVGLVGYYMLTRNKVSASPASVAIPKKIYQTHESIERINSNESLLQATKSWSKHKDYEYSFYDNEQCATFMKTQEETFPGINEQYNRLPLGVMKADLWRYCIIYANGGIYADSDTILMGSPNVLTEGIKGDLAAVSEPGGHPFLCQWVFSAPKHSPILKSVIELSVERLKNIPVLTPNNIGDGQTDACTVHQLTGPAVFTDGIKRCIGEDALYWNGEHLTSAKSSSLHHLEDPQSFHSQIVRHLYSGFWTGGWRSQTV